MRSVSGHRHRPRGENGYIQTDCGRRRLPLEARSAVRLRRTRVDTVPPRRDASRPGHRALPDRRVPEEDQGAPPRSQPTFREWSADAQPRGFPDTITISWPYGLTDPSGRVRAVKRGHADVTPLGQGPPLPKEEVVQLAAQYPAQLHFSTAFNTEYFFLNTRIPPFDDVRVRRAVNNAFDPHAFTASEGAEYAPTCRILPPNFPGYEPSCLYASGGIHGIDRARKQVMRAGAAGAHVTVWTLARIRQRGGIHGVPPPVDRIPRGRQTDRAGAAGPSIYFTRGRRSSEPGSDRLRRMAIADYPSAAGFIPPLLSCAAYTPDSPETNANLGGVLRPVDRREDDPGDGAAGDEPSCRNAPLAADRARVPCTGAALPTDNRRNVDFLSKRVGNYQYNPQWGVLLSQLWVSRPVCARRLPRRASPKGRGVIARAVVVDPQDPMQSDLRPARSF